MKKNVKSYSGEALASVVASSLSFFFLPCYFVDDVKVQYAAHTA
jgi:hypothetical protein